MNDVSGGIFSEFDLSKQTICLPILYSTIKFTFKLNTSSTKNSTTTSKHPSTNQSENR